MGVAYYANYLVWMEVGRVEYCKALGFRYRDMEIEDGVLLAVVEARCRYLLPARYDEEVIVETWMETPARGWCGSATGCARPPAAASWPPAKPSTSSATAS